MYGRVVNKHMRWNLCFTDKEQNPEYENKKGRIVAFNQVPVTNFIRKGLQRILNRKLFAEGNYYYDLKTCGIGWHGDTERSVVIGCRIGDSLPLFFRWYLQGIPIGDEIKINLNGGDMYLMSEKAVGQDWRKRTVPTLRHCIKPNGIIL